jgi:hypothetical protein
MRANLTSIFCPLGDGSYGIGLWRVDYTDIEGPTDYWLTFGVYEREEVARFVKSQIDKGNIIPPFYKKE